MTLTDGDDDDIGKSWNCWKVLWCELESEYDGSELMENSAEAWCGQATAFANAGMMYYICNLLALAFLSKYMVSCLAILMDKDPGHKIWMIVCSALFILFSLLGFAGWWGLSKVSYDASCDDDDYVEDLIEGDRWEMCAGVGATVSILAFCFTALAGILAIVNCLMQDDFGTVGISGDEVLCMGHKKHLIVVLLLLFISVVFGIISLVI